MKTDRIQKLRRQSLESINRISPERAVLLTEFYRDCMDRDVSTAVMRALAFEHILKNKYICINEGELIVGERGPAPKAVPTYPEICLHSPEDLEILDSRPKVYFKVDETTRNIYKEMIIPFWKGRSNRERIMQSMTPEWLDAYQAGVFTEFQEQRAPGHTVCGPKIYRKGMFDFIEEITQAEAKIDVAGDPLANPKRQELKAMKIAANALISFAERHAEKLLSLAVIEKDGERRKELVELAAICRKVPAHAPESFHEALQYYWFVHLGVITEVNPWDSFNPGRLDQHLYPFYKKGLEEGSLTREKATELLQSFWIKFNNHPAPPKVGVTAQESNTYTDFTLINLAGVTPDGEDAVNELTYLILDVIEEMRILQPGTMIQVSKKNPEELLHRGLKIVKTGFGQPSWFNTDTLIEELLRQGKSITDARNGGCSGCVETGAFGTESYILTGYFNLAKVLEIALNNGKDPVTGRQTGPGTGNPVLFSTFEELLEAFRKQLQWFIDIKIKGNEVIEQLFTDYLPVPFLSVLIDDCIENGTDYNAGGARYNTNYIQGVGLGSITDSLTAIKYHVFDNKSITMSELLNALSGNFNGSERLRFDLVYNTPKWGNDDDYADENAKLVFEMFYNAVDGRPTARGGTYRINMLPTTSHVYFGSVIQALPDGRKAKEPLSEGISPVQGSDTKGPTAVLNSAAKIDHTRTGGTLLNMKFNPSFFEDDNSIGKIGSLIRGYFRKKGHHIQFNVVAADTLRDAQKHPEKYRDLIVRVAGYSDYFNDLGTDLQNEIIKRTEQAV
jgi:trans-4-hydroxy-L-proline dehydratase